MGKHILFVVTIILSSFFTAFADTNSRIVLKDDFSSPNNWHSQGSGSVNVSNGTCNFSDAYSGEYNRIYRSLNQPLSGSYWKAECNFSITGHNPNGFATGAILMGLTAGNLDFMSYDSNYNYTETDQDGLAVILSSTSTTDNEPNDWYFLIESKKGSYRVYDLSKTIHVNSSIAKYYIRLERTSQHSARLSVFSDPTYTTHIAGSPVTCEIDPTISDLNTVQHGVTTPGATTRLLNGNLDDLSIIDDDNLSEGIQDVHNPVFFPVYPNPSNSIINIPADLVSSSSPKTYKIYNAIGEVILSGSLENSKQLDIATLAEGIYMLKISGTDKTYYTKFIKSN